MTIYCDNEYRIVKDKRGYVVINMRGEYEHHSHLKKESTCYLLIRLVKRRIVPDSKYLMEAARRISLDEKYIDRIERRQQREVQRYFNVNNGVR